MLGDDDRNVLRREVVRPFLPSSSRLNSARLPDSLLLLQTHKWHQPWQLYFLTICCSMSAAIQGMDESVVS